MPVWVPKPALWFALLTSTPTSSRSDCCTYTLRFWGFRPYSVSLMRYSFRCDRYQGQHSLRGVSHEITSLSDLLYERHTTMLMGHPPQILARSRENRSQGCFEGLTPVQ